MKNFAKIFRNTLVLFVFLFSILDLQSQPKPPAGSAGQNGPMGGAAPLDGGLSLIILLAIGYTTKKAISYQRKKKKNKQ
jgi:hypothetical protein